MIEYYINNKKYEADDFKKEERIKSWNALIDGKLHREEGPAYIDSLQKRWYKNGELHREDGPAYIVYDLPDQMRDGGFDLENYYLFDVQMSKERYDKIISNDLVLTIKKFADSHRKKFIEDINLDILKALDFTKYSSI